MSQPSVQNYSYDPGYILPTLSRNWSEPTSTLRIFRHYTIYWVNCKRCDKPTDKNVRVWYEDEFTERSAEQCD